MAYGLCKGIWMGEPAHRSERVDGTEHRWTSIEERQCLASLLESYSGNREYGTVPPDPTMDRLMDIVRDHMLDAYVIYELGSRVYPDIVLLMPEDSRDLIFDYVNSYVVTKRR